MLDPELLAQLRRPQGAVLLQEAEQWRDDPLRAVEHLRRRATPGLAAAACELARLRRRAARKFGRAREMFFTGALLEQASGDLVSRWRAQRYRGYERVADLCCGMGGDALSLAGVAEVLAVDRDPLALHLTRANVDVCGPPGRVQPVQADLLDFVPRVSAAFVDPGRREGGRRTRRLAAVRPPVEAILRIQAAVPSTGLKLSPATPDREMRFALAGVIGEQEFLSVGGECRELVVWMGDLASPEVSRRATLLPSGLTLTGTGEEPLDIRRPGCYLYEPDAAVIRSRLVARAAAELGAWGIDPALAYLSTDRLVSSPWATAYRIEPPAPFSRKRLLAALRGRGVATVAVKTRGSAIDPQEVRTWLKGVTKRGDPATRRNRERPGGQTVVFLTRIGGRAVMILGEGVGSGRNQTRTGTSAGC